MKKVFTFFALLFFALLFFGSGMYAQTGATCAEADTVYAVPYTATGLITIGTTYSSLPCSGSGFQNYMSGNDYVFVISPSETAPYTITLTNTSYAVGLFVTNLCPDDANVQCIASATSYLGNPTLTVTLADTGTYYIIVSSISMVAAQTNFDISIESCIIPPVSSFTYTNNNLDVTFTNTSTDATHYLWYFGDELLPPPFSQGDTNTNPMHTYTTYGDYAVTLISYNACGSTDTIIDTITIVCPGVVPVASFTYTQNGATVQFTSTSSDATSWQWFFGDTDIFPFLAGDSVENPTHTYIANGTYTINLIVSNECGSDTISQTVTITGLSVNAMDLTKMLIYPNPVKESVSINLNGVTRTIMELSDVTGKIIIKRELTDNVTTVNVFELQHGLYIVRLKYDAGVTTLPLIKE